MNIWLLRRGLAWLLMVLLAAPWSQASAVGRPQQSPDQQAQTPAGQQPAPLETRPQPNPSGDQQPATANKPVGTAAAPYETPTGITGSRPAGAVIAPAKQRRVHSVFIRIAIVAGAGAAVAAVALLAHASPSQPH